MSLAVRVSALLLLVLLYFGPRAAFLDRPLMGEEGVFADLIVHRSQPGFEGLMGRVQGQDYRLPLQHPVGLYASLAGLGRLASLGPDWHPTWALRASLSLYQLAVWAILVLWLAPRLWQRRGASALLALVLTTPLALGGSLYLQTDPSNGALLAGLLSLALAAAFQQGAGAWARRWALPLAAALLGLGSKQEWSLGLAGGLFLAWAWRHWDSGEPGLENGLLARCAAGLLAGNLASWALQPRDYTDGLKLMLGLGASHNALAGSKLSWLAGMYYRANFLLALGALWLALAWCWRGARGRERMGLRWALSLSLGLGGPFLAMAWGKDYRYFIPAYMLAAPFLVHHAASTAFPTRARRLAWLAGALLALHSAWFWQDAWRKGYCITERPYLSYAAYGAGLEQREREALAQGCVAALPTGLYWDRQGIDWIGDSMALGDQVRIAASFGRPLCRPAP